MQTNCILSAPILIPLHAKLCMLSVFVCFLLKSCPRHWIPCWLLTTLQWRLLWQISGAKINSKSKQVKEQWIKKLFAISMGKTRYVKHRKYKNLWIDNKFRGDKNATCVHFLPYLLNICRKFEFLISQGSVATCLRWGGSVI